ncbi:MAG: DUF4238 domain-containing protein [Candidatus Absconditabacteria bacterium]|nr:DUF4238 domain-containing protein [Candidatus Absconditabacteria bacterium]
MTNAPTRHHTIPCSYLRGFSQNLQGRDSMLWVYDVHTQKIREDKVDNFGWSRDFYTIEDGSGNKIYSIEEFLGENIDNVNKIIEKIDNKNSLTDDEIAKLALFISFQELRTPNRFNRNNSNELDVIKMSLREIFYHCETKEERAKSLNNTLKEYFPTSDMIGKEEEIIEKYEKGEEISCNNQLSNIKQMLMFGHEIADWLLSRAWVIIHNDNDNFIISDYPIYLEGDWEGPFGVGFGTAKTIGFPLSKKSYLMMTYDFKINDIKVEKQYTVKNVYQNTEDVLGEEDAKGLINGFNYQTCWCTNRNIAGNDKDYLLKIIADVDQADKKHLGKCNKSND